MLENKVSIVIIFWFESATNNLFFDVLLGNRLIFLIIEASGVVLHIVKRHSTERNRRTYKYYAKREK